MCRQGGQRCFAVCLFAAVTSPYEREEDHTLTPHMVASWKSADAADAAIDDVSTVKAEAMSTVMLEGVSRDTEVEHAAPSAVRAMDLLRDNKVAPDGMTVGEFSDGIWPEQEEDGMRPESTHPRPRSSKSSGSGDSIRSRTPRGDIHGNP